MSHRHQTDDCPEDLIPTRKSFLGRLKDWEDNESWRDFFDTYWKLIYAFAIQRGLSHEESQEVVQETVVAVAKSIGKFNYDPQVCSFKTWLLGVTRSEIANQFARRARQPPNPGGASPDDSSTTGQVNRVPDEQAGQWDKAWNEEWPKNLMEAAINRIGRGAYGEVWLARSVTVAYRAGKIVNRRSIHQDGPFEREFEGILKLEPISRTHNSQVDILHV